MLRLLNGWPSGFSTDVNDCPVAGSVRRGLARLYTTVFSFMPRRFSVAMVSALTSFE